MRLRILLTAILLIAVGSLFFYSDAVDVWKYISDIPNSAPEGLREESNIPSPAVPATETPQAVRAEEKEEVQLSGPLLVRKPEEEAPAALTKEGILFWTNVARAQQGLPLLGANAVLDAVAQAKLTDLFSKQYFDHVSPEGENVGDLAKEFGYAYIKVGENLALGNFDSNYDLVMNGWMNSPGHRANILGDGYREIGIAVGEGIFEGRRTWIAVQTFGTAISVCPTVDDKLRDAIDARSARLETLSDNLSQMADDIDNTEPKSGEEYRAKIDAYNEKVREYNTLLDELKQWVAVYNSQVRAFNACIEAY